MSGRRVPRRWATLATAALVALTAACRTPPPDDGDPGGEAAATLVEQLEGCWRLAPAGQGAEAGTVRGWMESGALPAVVRLDTARAQQGGDAEYRVAWSYVHHRKMRRPLSAWRPVGSDSLRVETPGALAGTVLRLAAAPDRLVGTATVFTDAVAAGESGRESAPVEARPETCPG